MNISIRSLCAGVVFLLAWGVAVSGELVGMADMHITSANIVTGQENSVSLSSFAKKPLLIEVWASWCAPCLSALPHLQEIKKQNASLMVMPISVDDGGIAAVASAYARMGINDLPVFLDKEGVMASMLNVHMYPTTMLYNSCGDLVYRKVGLRGGGHDELKTKIKLVMNSTC